MEDEKKAEPNSPSSSEDKPEQDNSTKKWLIILIAVLIIFGLLGAFFAWYAYNQQQNENTNPQTATSQTQEQSATQKTEPAKCDSAPEGFTEYQNQEIGFSMCYPKDWGQVNVEKSEGLGEDDKPAGHLLEGRFSQNKDVWFGSATYDFQLGTDSALLWAYGFEKIADTYYFAGFPYTYDGKKKDVIEYSIRKDADPEELPNSGIVYKQYSYVGSKHLAGYRAMFNTKEDVYNGLGFGLYPSGETKLDEFKKVVKTVEIFEPSQN